MVISHTQGIMTRSDLHNIGVNCNCTIRFHNQDGKELTEDVPADTQMPLPLVMHIKGNELQNWVLASHNFADVVNLLIGLLHYRASSNSLQQFWRFGDGSYNAMAVLVAHRVIVGRPGLPAIP